MIPNRTEKQYMQLDADFALRLVSSYQWMEPAPLSIDHTCHVLKENVTKIVQRRNPLKMSYPSKETILIQSAEKIHQLPGTPAKL